MSTKVMSLSARLIGGLGNQLFILAACESFSKQSGKNMTLSPYQPQESPHTDHNYFDTIFKNWKVYFKDENDVQMICEPCYLQYMDWSYFLQSYTNKNIILQGYFQNWKYIEPIKEQFIQRLSFNPNLDSKYYWIKDYFFLHVRGGDYLYNHKSLHYVDLKKYYKKCLDSIPNEQIVVFTNDVPFAESILKDYKYILFSESEEDTLYLMSQCKGGICANSTFSWWGAYLNPNRKLFLPSKWFNDTNYSIEGYFFPGATVVDVEC
jgi:Glycosyl transferase family 11